jgi:hypothetical protein
VNVTKEALSRANFIVDRPNPHKRLLHGTQ